MRPQQTVIRRLIFHQIVARTRFLLIFKSDDSLVIFPIAMAYHIIIAQIIHFSTINVYRNKSAILSISIEPTMQYHKAFSIRRNHNMIHLMLRTCHFLARFKGRKIRIFQNWCNGIIYDIQFPNASCIWNFFILGRFFHIGIAISRAQTMQPCEIKCQSKTSICCNTIHRHLQHTLYASKSIQNDRHKSSIAKVIINNFTVKFRSKPLCHTALLYIP